MCKSAQQGERRVRWEEFAGTAVSLSESTSRRSSPGVMTPRRGVAAAGSLDRGTARPINRRAVTEQTDTLGISPDNCIRESGTRSPGYCRSSARPQRVRIRIIFNCSKRVAAPSNIIPTNHSTVYLVSISTLRYRLYFIMVANESTKVLGGDVSDPGSSHGS